MGITISFTAESAAELEKLLGETRQFLGGQIEEASKPKGNGKNGHAVAAADSDADAAPKRRGRPPKAETEAKKVEAAVAAPAEEEPTDPFENPETLAEPEEEVSVISASQLKEAMQIVTDITRKKSVAEAQAILGKYGSKKISEVPAKQFPKFIEECKAALATA